MAYTAITYVDASRINPHIDDTDAPATNYHSIDDTNGNECDCGSQRNNIIAIVKNTSASNTLTVTQKAYYTHAGIVLPDEDTVIAAGSEAIIGPINHAAMLDSGVARFDFSGTTPSGSIIFLRVVANDG